MARTERRTYEGTHPWITFRLDLSKVDYRFWMNLGAVQSKIEHVAHALLPPGIASRLHSLYLAKGVHGTTAIEGNSLTEEQVRDRIVNKTELPESKEYLGKAVDNIVDACNDIRAEVLRGGKTELTPGRIQKFNEMTLKELPLAEHVTPGVLRQYSVGVANYKAPPWEECPYLLERLCQFLNQDYQPPSKELTTGFAVLQAIMAHLYIAWIHPFGDGNGRTARLLEFQILLMGGVPTIAAHLLSNFYNETRDNYYRQLAAASQSGGNVSGFLCYAIQGLRDQLDGQIQHIQEFQRKIAWRDFVYERFQKLSGDAARRRRMLALGLPQDRFVQVPELRRITPALAELYATRTNKTLTRDLNELEGMKLIRRTQEGVRANREILMRFLPGRKQQAPAAPADTTAPESDASV